MRSVPLNSRFTAAPSYFALHAVLTISTQASSRRQGMVDYQKIFASAPARFLVLGADETFPILDASDAYLRATYTERDAIIGRPLFDVFPDNPDDPTATGIRNLRSSLHRVLTDGRSDAMAVQRYDVRRTDGHFEERYWSPVNAPVIGPNGEILYIVHRVEDVTEISRTNEFAADREETMRLEVLLRAQELQEAKPPIT
jgi:PAS domain-containing protein